MVAALLVGVPVKAAETRVACPDVLPDEASASRVAKECGRSVEVLAGRSEQTQIFANPDGTTTFTATAMPERKRLADGSWTDIDTTLRVREDGWLVPVATLADVAFSPGGSGPFVTYRDEGSNLTLGLGTGRLPRPKVEGDTATYANVMPGVDLAVSATATGFRHVLVVKTRAAAVSRSLRSISLVVGGDAKAQAIDGDRVRFADGRGRTIAITETAAMWDSAVRPALVGERTAAASADALAAMKANPGEGLRSSPARAGVTAREAKIGVAAAVDGKALVLTPDADFLLDESVALPIYIDPQVGPTQTKWAYTRSNNVNFNTSDGHARVGLNSADGTLFRAFYEMPTTVASTGLTWIGKQVLAASVSSKLYHSWSCHPTPAYLYRPQPITVAHGGRMGWNDRPLGATAPPASTVYLGSASGNANKAGGCGVLQPDMVMTWSGPELLADVRLRAQQSASEYTVAICACDYAGGNNNDESTQDRWKKFYRQGGTSMSVTFNTVPDPPANLSPHNGQVACGSIVATSSPMLRAQYVDTDDNDTLTGTFQYREVGGSTVTVAGPALVAGAYGSVTVNLGAAAEGKQYEFRARTNDGNADSPWSHPDAGPWCRFTVDTTAPPAPVVEPVAAGTAPVYEQCDATNLSSCVAQGGPGEAGGFRFSVPPGPQGQDVTTYVYGWDSTPTTSVSVAPGQPTPTILLTPPRYGLNRIAVFARDGTGKEGPTTVFTFLVGSPASAAAHWPLTSIDGHYLSNQVGGGSLNASNVTWTGHARYYGADAATFTAGSASQSVPSFDTSGSFSVAAWVRPASCDDDATVVAVDGDSSSGSDYVSGFLLGYECATSRWQLTLPATNTADPELAAVASVNGSLEVGRWTLLIAGWDEAAQQLWLSVDGVTSTATPSTSWLAARGSGWKATGPVTIGRGRQGGADTAGFTGEIADVRLWNRVLVEQDLTGADADPVNGVLATNRVFAPIPVGEWAFADDTCLCTSVPDGSIFGRWATLVPNWSLDPFFDYDPASAPAWLQGPGHDGNGEVRLDGTGGHVSTADDRETLDPADDDAVPVLHTDQSLSISVWARTEQSTGADQVVVSAGPIDLMRRDSDGKWAMVMRSGGSVISTAVSDAPAPTGTSAFTHLVGVFDAAANTLTLYVDGVKQSVIGTGATGGDFDASLTFGSRGASGHFAGSIDDVRVYQGVLIDREIAALYSAV